MITKEFAVATACANYNCQWPKDLTSGIMYFYGFKITIEEFNAWSINFK